MALSLTVLYPKEGADSFNMDYYLKTHMPLVEKTWKPYGLQSWAVTQMDNDGKNPYIVQATIVFKTKEGAEKAYAEAISPVMDDVKNFATVEPVKLTGGIIASHGI